MYVKHEPAHLPTRHAPQQDSKKDQLQILIDFCKDSYITYNNSSSEQLFTILISVAVRFIHASVQFS